MFDSIKCHIKLNSPLDVQRFHYHRALDDSRHGMSERHWIASDNINITYRHAPGYYDGVLSIETALSYWTNIPRNQNPTMQDYELALDRVNDHIAHLIGYTTDIRDWQCSRVDYCFNLSVDDARSYINLLSSLWCGSLTRVHSKDAGVVWKNDSRWVKFYDKEIQMGMGTHGTLRFEVSNHKAAVRYMCKHWFGCARVVREVLQPMRALYVLSRYWMELGLHVPSTYETDIALHTQLATLYGRAAPTALGVLRIIQQYGSEAHKLSLISSSTFYRWRKTFTEHGLLATPTHSLPVLHINHSFFINQHAQNLVISTAPPDKPTKKTGGKIRFENFGLKIRDERMAEVFG